MNIFKIENLNFTYPNSEKFSLSNINLNIEEGEFVCLCGESGSGKTTLLRHLKTALTPHGNVNGEILFLGKALKNVDIKEQSEEIGYVLQDIENQIVTDKVWHELAFGLENLGVDSSSIRLRVAEMASFFGIADWFLKDTDSLSGGQKQILNLASIMVMQPKVLILDEPTSQLDPIAAHEFLQSVKRINIELGTTIIISEHRLEEVLPLSDKVVVMEKGEIIICDTPKNTGKRLSETENNMFNSMPTPMQIYFKVKKGNCPITVKEGREWLFNVSNGNKANCTHLEPKRNDKTAVKLQNIWFKYEKDVLKDLTMDIKMGEIYAIVGGNAAGKTTALKIMGKVLKPYSGKIKVEGKTALLPQNPKTIFTEKTVELELTSVSTNISEVVEKFELQNLLNMHPFDLSGGEMQRVALAKIFLLNTDILLLDEPTKGMDANFKEKFAKILKVSQKTIILVSHDIEFCASFADRCALFFWGDIITENGAKNFFVGNSFYTTAANRMARDIIKGAVTKEDVICKIKEEFYQVL